LLVGTAFSVLAAGAAGCVKDGAFLCSISSECTHDGMQGTCEPSGYCSFPDSHCASGNRYGARSGPVAELCTSGSGSDNDGGLADSNDAAIDPCGSTVLLQDGFDDGVPAPLFMTSAQTGLTVSEANSLMTVTFASTVNGNNYAAYRSVGAYSADGLCAAVEVQTAPPVSASNAAIYFKLYTSQQQVEFLEWGGTMNLRTRMDNTVATVAQIPWDPVADRFLRVRQQGGMAYWETSPDGVSYATRAMVTGFAVGNWQLEFGGGAVANVSNAGLVQFASVRVTGP